MSTTDPVSKPDELSPERVGLVRDHLKEVIASHAFAGSKRAQDFLQLIVEHALAGRLDSLRERMIGAEMFGRPVDYDTANDAVVRVKATEVRRKLAQYYQEAEKKPAIRIELPVGSYVPRFHWECLEKVSEPPAEAVPVAAAEPATAQEQPAEKEELPHAAGETVRRTPRVLVGLAGLVLLAAIGYVGFKVWPKGASARPEVHSIAILPLQNLSGDPQQDYFADGMTEELIADLGQVSALRVISRTSAMTYKGTKKTLPEIARFADRGLWSHEAVWFSRYGTLLSTVEAFVLGSSNGYYAHELADFLHAEVQEPLRHLVQQGRLSRTEVAGQFVYTAIDSTDRRNQTLARRSAQAVPLAVHSVALQVSPDELKAAIVLFYGLLDEQQRRLFAGLESIRVGHGGDTLLGDFLGLDAHTVARGRQQLLDQDVVSAGMRRKGGGRQSTKKKRQT